jgi:KamA family protein
MKNSLEIYVARTSKEEQSKVNQEFQQLSEQESLLPIKVTSFYRKKIEEEIAVLGHTEGPLHRISYPSKEKMKVRAPGEVADFVDDRHNMPEGIPDTVIRKYENRILFLPTSVCAGHCQYCFRQDVLSEQHSNAAASLEEKLESLKKYLKDKPEIKEVILSGGDPMILPFKSLQKIIQTLKEDIKIESIRIHTKTICYSPHVFHDDEKLKLLAKANVRLVFHIVHPYEVCSEVQQTIMRIRSHHIRCYSQFPLLRNINDHVDLLIYHLKNLDNLGVRNLSIFIPDPIYYSGAFRIRLNRLFDLINQFNWKSPSWINSTRFVLDTPIGKVRREDMKSYDEQSETAIFEREGKQVIYPDFPLHLDKPGELETLLWKGTPELKIDL